jgi:CTP synthase (UTP-ammonia lyase)
MENKIHDIDPSIIKIAMIGDYNDAKTSHKADKLVTALQWDSEDKKIIWDWIETPDLSQVIPEQLSPYQGIWCVPGSPYKNMEGVLSAIKFARESGTPFLGTCGGFQHAVIEYARNVLHLDNAAHTEYNPNAEVPVIDLLECSLVEKTDSIHIQKGSKLFSIMKKNSIAETYHCRYGINKSFEKIFETSDLNVSGRDASGEIRAIELKTHRFFICTLFQIERSALKGERHPLIEAFIRAASSHYKTQSIN